MNRLAALLSLTLLLHMACSDNEIGTPTADSSTTDRGAAEASVPDGKVPDAARADLAASDSMPPDAMPPDGMSVADDLLHPDQKVVKPDAAPNTCAGIKKAVTDEMARIAKCATTAECTFLWGVCPFGCHIPHNKKADLAKYKAAIAAYQASSLCQKCAYKCTKPGSLSCKSGKCVMSYP